MKATPVTVTPETTTLRAMELMREHQVGCLPVLKGGKLLGLVTEKDLIRVAALLLEQFLTQQTMAQAVPTASPITGEAKEL
jgi:CBS domain-containing protein